MADSDAAIHRLRRDRAAWRVSDRRMSERSADGRRVSLSRLASLGPPWTPTSTDRVGIWKRRGRSNCWERDADLSAYWDLWADHDYIQLDTSESPRIVLIGESVARAFLLDPLVTIASSLEQEISARLGKRARVVDLASVDQSPSETAALARQCRVLDPDAVILFAGNNWTDPSVVRPAPAQVLTPDDVEREINSQLLRARGYAEDILGAATDHTSAVVVIPAVNLADWRSGWNLPTWLSPAALATWLRLRRRLLRARPGTPEAVEMATEMSALDQATSAPPLEVVGRGALARGRTEESRYVLERARDVAAIFRESAPPRCTTSVTRAITGALGESGTLCVDLTKATAMGPVPGRAMFFDYCHLSLEGVGVVVPTLADTVGKLLGMRVVEPGTARPPKIADAEMAVTELLAAVHNAHWNQPEELVGYWLRRALARNSTGERALACYLEGASRHVPPWVCSDNMAVLSGRHSRYFRMSSELWQARYEGTMLSCLEGDPAGDLLLDVAARTRAGAAAAQGEGTDLARPFWRLSPTWGRDALYINSASLEWNVHNCLGGRAFLTLMVRCPTLREDAGLDIEVDGETIAEVTLGPTWTRHEIDVLLPNGPGGSILSVRIAESADGQIGAGVERGLQPALHIAQMRISACRRPDTTSAQFEVRAG